MQLTFKIGKFILENIDDTFSRELLQSGYWKSHQENLETTNLKAAAVFRHYGDSRAKKVFKRAFQKHYDLDELKLPPLPQLDPHQRKGLEWILSRKRSYLAHAPGAGKTAQAILASILCKGVGQVLFIVPPSLTLNWEREIMKVTEWIDFFPTISIVPNSIRQNKMAWRSDFIICPDSMLTKSWVYERIKKMKKKFIAVDEASRFKESETLRSIAFYGGRFGKQSYSGLYQDARHVIFLDGSPMPNRPMELWAPTYALHPEAIDCMDQDDFGYRYCGPRLTDHGQYTFDHSCREEELQAKLQKDFMHVVKESELSHPERLRSMVYMSGDLRSSEQKSWEKTNIKKIHSFDEKNSLGDLARFRREIGIKKIPFIVDYTKQKLDKNESILLFAWHRDVVEGLEVGLKSYEPCVVIGGVSHGNREDLFRQFQNGKRKLIIGNISAMGRGHNLQHATRILFGEYSWTDELNRQCEKRASRRGNNNSFIRCEYIVVANSMDEIILNSLFTKERRVRRIIG